MTHKTGTSGKVAAKPHFKFEPIRRTIRLQYRLGWGMRSPRLHGIHPRPFSQLIERNAGLRRSPPNWEVGIALTGVNMSVAALVSSKRLDVKHNTSIQLVVAESEHVACSLTERARPTKVLQEVVTKGHVTA